MKGSGLSLDRFSEGKKQPHKAFGKKRKRNENACRIRKFKKTREQHINDVKVSSTRSTFYDKFFSSICPEEKSEKVKRTLKDKKPDPLFKAKKVAEETKVARKAKKEEMQRMKYSQVKKERVRKRNYISTVKKTHKGQPIMKNHVSKLLSRIENQIKK